MKLTVIGGDERIIEATKTLKNNGHTVDIYGLVPKNDDNQYKTFYKSIESSEALILPLPMTKDGKTVFAPLSNEYFFLEDIYKCCPKFIFGGLIKKDQQSTLKELDIPYYDYYTSENITLKNAALTAEAAVSIAIESTSNSIYEAPSLVIGYGRIGKALCRYLKAMNSIVTASTRDNKKLEAIINDGYNAVNTELLIENCLNYDYIFNTAPTPILNEEFFKNCKNDVFIEDLATDSGIDIESAKRLKINADVYSGLPGKYSPKTSGRLIANEIEAQLRNEKENDI